MEEAISIKENIRERYRELFHNSLDLIYVIDINGNFIDANDIALDTFGYKREEIPDIKFKDLVHEEQLGKAINALKEIIKNGRNQDYIELKVNTKNGDSIYLETYGIPIKGNGRVYAIIGIANDITARKKTEQKLKESEERYRLISENAIDMIAIINQKFEFEYINEEIANNLKGQSEGDLRGKNVSEVLHPDDLKKALDALRNGFITGEGGIEVRVRHKNGNWIWIDVKGKTYTDDKGDEHAIIISRDITKRIEAEQRLQESENVLKKMVRELNCLYSISTILDRPEISINELIESILELIPHACQFPALTCARIIYDNKKYESVDFKEIEWKFSTKVIVNEKPLKITVYSLENVPFLKSEIDLIKEIGNRLKIIIEQKESKQQLKESEKMYRVISENAYDMITVLNEKFEYEYINETVHKNVLGYSKEDLIGRSAIEKVHPNDVSGVAKKWRKGVKTGEESGELRYRKKDGTYLWLEVRGKMFKDREGVFKGILIARDINKRKIAEEKLKESEKKYRSILENMREGYVEIDLKGNFTFVNKRVSEYLGYSKDELLSMKVHQIIANADIDDILESINKLYKKEVDQLLLDFEAITKVGPRKFIEASVYLKYDSLGKKVGFFGMYRDITEKKESEELIKREREKLIELDLLKRDLTTQLSEKLKYPISVISDVSEVLLESYQDRLDKNAQRLIELIRDGGEKSANMIERILDISKIESDRFELNKRVENLNEIVNESIHRAYEDLDFRDVGINLRSSEDLFSEVDKIRFKQIFEYYLTNSLRTIPKKGSISILLKEKKNYAIIEIKSSGIELKQDEFPFELQYSDDIIKLHQGDIKREFNREEKSRTIKIRLPIIKWVNQLIHIFVIYKTGILLYDHPFVKERDSSDSLIISGGLIGTMSILKEIIKGADKIRTIDHGDRKIMFELNNTEDVVFALLVKEENQVIRRKLNALIRDFERFFKEKIKDIKYTSMRSNEWKEVRGLIKKHFRFQD